MTPRQRLAQSLTHVLLIGTLAAGCDSGTGPDTEPLQLSRIPLDAWTVIQPFGAWNANWGGYHLAVDAVAPAGTPVYAAEAGRVLLADPVVTGYGALVLVMHRLPAGSVTTLYGHLSARRGLAVATGDSVVAGQLLGTAADNDEDGGPWGPHLHFGVRRGTTGLDAETCGAWPYVGYTRTCAGWSHERFLSQWRDPHDVLPFTFLHQGHSAAFPPSAGRVSR